MRSNKEESLPPWMCDTFASSPSPSRVILNSSPLSPRRLLLLADDAETKKTQLPDDPKTRNRVLMERIRDECKMLSQLCDTSEESRAGRMLLGNEGFSNGRIFYQPPDLCSDNEVVVWLKKLHMEKYAPAFAAEGYDELWLLARITKSDMQNLGIAASDMNQILLPALARLRETLGEGERTGDVKASFAEIMRDMEERIEKSEKELRVQKDKADDYMKQLDDAERRYEDTLKLKEKEKRKIMQDLELSRRDVEDAKHAVEIAKRDTEDVRTRLNDALNRFEDENSKILVIRREAADDVMEAQRAASAQMMKLRQENLQIVEKIRMECADRIKEMMQKNQERIASAHHAAQEQIAEAQREAARLVADAQKQAFQKTVDEESIWEERLDKERAKAARVSMEVNAEAERRISIIQDKTRDTIREIRSEISKREADVVREKNRADQLNWVLEHEREEHRSLKRRFEELKSEHSKRQEALVLRVATLEQNLFESRDETAREKEKRVSMDSKMSRLIVRAENAEKLSEELREAQKKNREKYEELMEKERRRHAQSAAVKEITSGLEKDLRAAAASGAAIASLQAEVERASQRAEMAAKKAESCFQDIRRVDSSHAQDRNASPPGILRPSKPIPTKPVPTKPGVLAKKRNTLKDAVVRRNTDMLMDDFSLSPSVLNDAEKDPSP